MRNVPVGAGRRKNKSAVPPHYRHVTVSDANSTPNNNGTVLSFGRNAIHQRVTEERTEEQSCGSSLTVANSNEDGFAPFPMPFYPAAVYWGCNPWLSTLGKHRREPDLDAENNTVSETGEERNRLWFPKSLRIAEPEEASKSSMGFKSFQKKGEVRAHLTEASQALHANPAALSRAVRFQESSHCSD